jgi:hypothetical protein
MNNSGGYSTHTYIYIYIITGLRQTLFEGDREGYIHICTDMIFMLIMIMVMKQHIMILYIDANNNSSRQLWMLDDV